LSAVDKAIFAFDMEWIRHMTGSESASAARPAKKHHEAGDESDAAS